MKTVAIFSLSCAGVMVACSTASDADVDAACEKEVSSVEAVDACFGGARSNEPKRHARALEVCRIRLRSPGTRLKPVTLERCAAARTNYASTACRDEGARTRMEEECAELPGEREAGEPCGSSEQCASLSCQISVGRCGICVPRVPVGGDCRSGLCETGTSCVYDQGYGGRLCKPYKPLAEGGKCNPGECMRDLTCPTGGPRKGLCTRPAAFGEACDSEHSAFCEAGLRCLAGLCQTAVAEGEPCARAGECQSPLVCSRQGRCIRYVERRTGETCGADEYFCAEGRCSETAVPTCSPPLPDGARCSPGDSCSLYAGCIDGVCMIFDPKTCD